MEPGAKTVRLKVDGYTQFCLGAIVVLMTVMIVGLWAERTPGPDRTVAAERYQPRSTLEISDLVKTQEQTNEKLDQLLGLLESGKVKVQLVEGPAKDTGGEKNVQPTTTHAEEQGGLEQGVHPN